MLFHLPVPGTIRLPGWKRPAGNHDFILNQDFGPGISAEPKVIWPGGEGFAAATYPHFHQGIDLYNGRSGDPVLSAAAGTIDFAAVDGTGNRVVIVNHGRFRTWYGHLLDDTVSKGQLALAGKTIGHVGQSGHATGPHLHFGVEWLDFPGTVSAEHHRADGTTYFDHHKFVDPQRRLGQFVTVHPRLDKDGIRLRTARDLTAGSIYAVTDQASGRITRTDGVDLGATPEARDWDWPLEGAEYTVDGKTSTSWDRIFIDSRWLYIGSLLAVRSA